MECKPLKLVEYISNKYEGCWENVSMFLDAKKKGELNWDDRCFLPISASIAITSQGADFDDIKFNNDVPRDAAVISAVAPWRLYKQIYSFPIEMEQLLLSQAEDIVVPVDALNNLPYPSIYIETKSFPGIDGFFAYFEHDANDGRMEFRLLILCDTLDVIPISIHLVNSGTIKQGIEEMVAESKRVAASMSEVLSQKVKRSAVDNVDKLTLWSTHLMQLVLYICAQNNEISEDESQKRITRIPKAPEFVKDKFREVRKWNCGEKTSKIIRGIYNPSNYINYNYADTTGSGTPKSPHSRRGHWHHFWTGSERNNDKRLMLKWVAPTFINADKVTEDDDVIKINEIRNSDNGE